ncbi:MAG: HD domain-containing protein [Verrucomicrobium sp.]|nr:HD domain-containing protein [Verrucomicrobium sp.]
MTDAERMAGYLVAEYEREPEHVTQVAALAEQLFSSLLSWHGYGDRERLLLRLAALLHDSGKSQPGGRGHHLESARLIAARSWPGLTADEVAVVAQIARYHRKELPAPEHEAYMALPPAARTKVDRLGGLLRVADALDRTHEGRVAWVSAVLEPGALRVRVVAGSWKEERQGAERKKDLLERAAGRPVLIEEG